VATWVHFSGDFDDWGVEDGAVGAPEGLSARQQLSFFEYWATCWRQWDGLQQAGFGDALPA